MKRPARLLLLAAATLARTGHAGEEAIRLEDGPGRELTAARCAICHSLDYIEMNAPVMNRAAWEKSLRKMVDRFGAPVSDAEAGRILEYLAQHYSGS